MLGAGQLALLLYAFSPREGVEYCLLSSDGRYLVADGGQIRLVREQDATNSWRGAPRSSRFTFVRVGDSSTVVYLQFGDALLNAPASEEVADAVTHGLTSL